MANSVLHDILATGVNEGASDWHFREGATVGLRISTKLVDLDFEVTREFLERAANEINQAGSGERSQLFGQAAAKGNGGAPQRDRGYAQGSI